MAGININWSIGNTLTAVRHRKPLNAGDAGRDLLIDMREGSLTLSFADETSYRHFLRAAAELEADGADYSRIEQVALSREEILMVVDALCAARDDIHHPKPDVQPLIDKLEIRLRWW